jgi:hypothetical protein
MFALLFHIQLHWKRREKRIIRISKMKNEKGMKGRGRVGMLPMLASASKGMVMIVFSIKVFGKWICPQRASEEALSVPGECLHQIGAVTCALNRSGGTSTPPRGHVQWFKPNGSARGAKPKEDAP